MAETIQYEVKITPRTSQVQSVQLAEGSRSLAILDETNVETLRDVAAALPGAGASAKAGLSDLATMLQSADASFTSTLQTAFANLMSTTEADALTADDVEVVSGYLAAIAAADASLGTTQKDAMQRLLALIIADEDISSVITAIAALE